MGYWGCDNPDEHKQQARDDYRYRGRYGYDREMYNDPTDDCHKAYTDEFNKMRRDEDRRREEREEEEHQEYLAQQAAAEAQAQAEAESGAQWQAEEAARAEYEAQQGHVDPNA